MQYRKGRRLPFWQSGIVLLCAVLLCSCGVITFPSNKAPGEEKTSESESEAPQKEKSAAEYLEALQLRLDTDTPLVIATTDAAFLRGGEDGDCDLLRAQRYAMIQQKLGVQLLIAEYDVQTLYQSMYNAVLSGSENYICDLLMLPRTEYGLFAAAGLLDDLRSVPSLSLDAPYFDSDQSATTASGRAIYGAYGAASDPLDRSYAVFCNNALLPAGTVLPDFEAEGYSVEDLLASAQAAGQGISVPAELFSHQGLCKLFFGETSLLKTGYYQKIEYAPDYDALQALSERVNALERGMQCGSREAFLRGECAVYIDTLQFCDTLRDSAVEYWRSPLPCGGAYTEAPVFCIPRRVQNAENSGQLLTVCMAAFSGMRAQYIAGALEYTLHSADSYRALTKIVEQQSPSASLNLVSGISSLSEVLYRHTQYAVQYGRDVKSFAAKTEETVRAELAEAFEDAATPAPGALGSG